MQMDMILADTTPKIVTLRDTHFWRVNFLARWGYIPFQNVIPVFRHPNKMLLYIIDRMRAFVASFALAPS